MKKMGNILYSEIMKMAYTKVCRIVTLLVILVQCLLAYVSAKQIMTVGLTAVPTADNGLLEPMPPIEYMGFDVIMFASIPMIVLGAMLGASEFKQHCLRTTLLCYGNKKRLFLVKALAVVIIAFLIAFVSTILTIVITHLTFGKEGLSPFVFNETVWKFILLSTVSLTMLTVLSYAFGFLSKTAVVPLLFLIVQAYNVGNLLAEKFEVCRYLPVNLSNGLIACSENSLSEAPFQNILGLLLWIFSFFMIGYVLFCKIDLQGEY